MAGTMPLPSWAPLLTGRRILVLRHGNTGRAPTDALRQLTTTGKEQCSAFRAHYEASLAGVTNCLASPVSRTLETAKRVLQGRDVAITPVDELYFGREGFKTDTMRAADQKLGYAPVADYVAEAPGAYEPGAREMAAAVGRAAAQFGPGDVLIAAHATYLSFLTLELIDAIAPQVEREMWVSTARAAVLPVNVGEVCGFELTADGVTYLPNPLGATFGGASGNDDFVASL
jgi:broad specificity phosphatase PhoE